MEQESSVERSAGVSRRNFVKNTGIAALGASGAAILLSACTSTTSAAASAAAGTATSHLDSIVKNKTLRVGMTLQFKPEMFRDANNQPAGYDVELMKQMATDLGAKLDIHDLPFEGLIPGLLDDKFDLISVGLVNTPKRALTVWFSGPYVPYKQVLVVNNSVTATSVDELNKAGVKITALTGSTASELAKRKFPNATIVELDQQPALLEVSSGRAQGVVVEEYLARPFVRQNPTTVHILNPDQPFALEYGQYAFQKGDIYWKDWLANWLDYWRAKGLLDSLYANIIQPTL